MITLVDTGATHNFISEKLVDRLGLQTDMYRGFRVMVASVHQCLSSLVVNDMPLHMGECDMTSQFYVVPMSDYDCILGMTWMKTLHEFTFNLDWMDLKFEHQRRKLVIRTLTDKGLKVISLRRMERLIQHDQVQWATGVVLMLEESM